MKKDSKKALYESIMTSVAKEVKKALNEDNSVNGVDTLILQQGFELGKLLSKNANTNLINRFLDIICDGDDN